MVRIMSRENVDLESLYIPVMDFATKEEMEIEDVWGELNPRKELVKSKKKVIGNCSNK